MTIMMMVMMMMMMIVTVVVVVVVVVLESLGVLLQTHGGGTNVLCGRF